VIVGDGDDRPRLEALARERGLAGRVHFAGQVSDSELPDYYRLADVFVMPSTKEGFGIVFLEAAASGLPVIGGDRDGSADALADGAIGAMVDPDDDAALDRAIGQALDAPRPDAARVAPFRVEAFRRRVAALVDGLAR
jgi:phosphatidylinositol alpha-1,6-mannosyltransferase